MFGWWSREHKRKQLLAQPFPASWDEILTRNVAQAAWLPVALQSRLRDVTRILVAERRFEGVGLEVTEEMKVSLAAQAALLLLGVEGYYFERLPSILVRAGSFSRKQRRPNWLEEEIEVEGIAAQHGPISLSWREAQWQGQHPEEGENVVLHEFAHHLDGLDGEMGGSLTTGNAARDKRIAHTLAAEYQRQVEAVEDRQPTLVDPHGAENAAEFFAYSVERFYCLPRPLRSHSPALYAALAEYFQIDPAEWTPPT